MNSSQNAMFRDRLGHLSLVTRLPRRSLGEGGSLLLEIQRGDIDLVDVAQSVARTVQLLQEFLVA